MKQNYQHSFFKNKLYLTKCCHYKGFVALSLGVTEEWGGTGVLYQLQNELSILLFLGMSLKSVLPDVMFSAGLNAKNVINFITEDFFFFKHSSTFILSVKTQKGGDFIAFFSILFG